MSLPNGEKENIVSVVFKEVFGRLVETTSKLPAPLAYGGAITISILVFVLIGGVLPNNLIWFLGLVIFACLIAFVLLDWKERKRTKEEESTEKRKFPNATGTNKTSENEAVTKIKLVRLAPIKERKVSYESTTGQMTLGRNSKSTVRFPKNERGISWDHGMIYFIEDTFYYRHLSKSQETIIKHKHGDSQECKPEEKHEIPLTNNDTLVIGKYKFLVMFDIIGISKEIPLPTKEPRNLPDVDMSNTDAAVKKTIILVAAGGDGSRIFTGLVRRNLPHSGKLPISIRQQSLPTMPVAQGHCFLDIILGATENLYSRDTPVAIITGPNTHTAISNFVHNTYRGNLKRIAILLQDSHHVFTTEGNVVYWEDGEILRAPDGTAGCLGAFARSDQYKQWLGEGFEYTFLWYGNDISVGTHLRKYMNLALKTEQAITWLSDDRGTALVNKINSQTPIGELPSLCNALEDAPGAYIIRNDFIQSILLLTDWHKTIKKAPALGSDGQLLDVYKRERFLSDVCWKMKDIQEYLPTIKKPTIEKGERKGLFGNLKSLFSGSREAEVVSENRTTDSRQTLANQEFFNILSDRDKLIEALEKGKPLGLKLDIGEKTTDDFLIDDHRILEVIKSGGMGIVYICQDQDSDTPIAVKTFKDEIRWNKPNFVRRFWHEANSWVTLKPHPNIVKAFRVRDIDGRLHIFMEYVPGETLRTKLHHQKLELGEAIRIGINICDGIKSIHQQNLIHRDIKPENILLTNSGAAKITDFGIVDALGDPSTKEAIGTPFYMPPEQYQSPEKATFSADIYSLGVVLYEMFAGHRPFSGQNSTEILENQLNFKPEELPCLSPEIPTSLADIIIKSMNVDPDQRAMLHEIRTILLSTHREITGRQLDEPISTTEISPDGSLSRANSLIALKKYDEGLAIYTDILTQYPLFEPARINLAWTHFTMGNYNLAICECLDMICSPSIDKEHIPKADELIKMSMIMMGVPYEKLNMPLVAALKGKMIDSKDIAQTAIDSELYVGRSILAAMGNGDMNQALQYANVAIKLNDESPTAWYHRGQWLYNQGRYEEALEALEKASEYHYMGPRELSGNIGDLKQRCKILLFGPDERMFLEKFSMGTLLMEMGNFGLAEKTLRQAVEMMPENGDARMSLGIALKEQNKLDAAIDEFNMAIQYSPQSAPAWFNRGLAFDMRSMFELQSSGERTSAYLRDRQLAYESFQCALNLEGNHYQARNMMAEYMRQDGKLDEAKKGFERSLEIEPESGVALMALTQIYLDQGNPEKAITYAEKGIRLYPNNPSQQMMFQNAKKALMN